MKYPLNYILFEYKVRILEFLELADYFNLSRLTVSSSDSIDLYHEHDSYHTSFEYDEIEKLLENINGY